MVTDININLSRNILMFDNIFASYFLYEEKESSSLKPHIGRNLKYQERSFLGIKNAKSFPETRTKWALKVKYYLSSMQKQFNA